MTKPRDDTRQRSQILKALFRFLEAEGIAYCVVGDTRSYPDVIAGDIDIVVPHAALVSFPSRLASFARAFELQLVQTLSHDVTATCLVLTWMDEREERQYLHPDVCSDYYQDGRRLLTADELVQRRVQARDEDGTAKGFFIPAPELAFIYYLLKRVGKGGFDDRQGAYLSELWRLDPPGCRRQTSRFWAAAHATEIEHAAASNDWQTLKDKVLAFRKALQKAVPHTMYARVANRRQQVRRVLYPPGLFVILCDCGDGQTPSSLWQEVAPCLEPAFGGPSIHISLLSTPSQSRQERGIHAVEDRTGMLPDSTARLLWRTVYLRWVYWTRIRSLLTHARLVTVLMPDSTLFRHMFDSRSHISSFLHRWVVRLIPKPDLILVRDITDVSRSPKPYATLMLASGLPASSSGQNEGVQKEYVLSTPGQLQTLSVNVQRDILGYMARRARQSIDGA